MTGVVGIGCDGTCHSEGARRRKNLVLGIGSLMEYWAGKDIGFGLLFCPGDLFPHSILGILGIPET